MAVVFEISGTIGLFRKPYTTTSSVSFPFPPPTAVAGLVAAVLGIPHHSEEEACRAGFWDRLNGTRVGIRIVNPIRWQTATVNFWNVKAPQQNPHIQVKHQYLADPRFRIYLEGGVEGELCEHLARGSFIFTPYLGVAYALADLDYLGSYPDEPVTQGPVEIQTVLPYQDDMEIDVWRSGGFFKETVPYRMDTVRKLTGTQSVLYPSPGKTIYLDKWNGGEVSRCGPDLVAWFPPW